MVGALSNMPGVLHTRRRRRERDPERSLDLPHPALYETPMTYTITNNATMGTQTSQRETAAEAFELVLELQASGHSTILVSDGGGALSLAELEARTAEG